MGVAVLSVSSAVVADVILNFTLSNNINASGVSPFQWDQGSNYPLANGLLLATGVCTTGSLGTGTAADNCYALTSTISGVGGVATQLLDIYAFTDLGWTTGYTAAISPAEITFSGGTAFATPTTDCAYIIVSDAPLLPGNIALTATPCAAGGITVTPTGTLNAPCVGGTVGAAIWQANNGVAVGTSTYTCTAVGTTTGSALDVSYVIVNPGAEVINPGASMDINVAVT